MTIKTKKEIKKLGAKELTRYYGELKAEEANAQARFEAACRNVVVSGITSHHQTLLDQIKLVERRLGT